jgi:hypothetical protein
LFGVSVRADQANGLVFGLPIKLDVPVFGERHWGTQYDISPDGQRVLFPHPGNDQPPTEMRVILGWRALLE